MVQIPAEEFKRICASLRTNELLGPAAADALEMAAGLKDPGSPGGARAQELRKEVAEARDLSNGVEEKKKKKGGVCMFQQDEPDDIPDLEWKEEEEAADEAAQDKEEPPELNLTPKQNHMRTDLEMWVMDEIPALYGVDDSEELEEDLQEDGQALYITKLIAEEDEETQKSIVDKWLKGAPDPDAKSEFVSQILEKVVKIQSLGPKKKKKKKG